MREKVFFQQNLKECFFYFHVFSSARHNNHNHKADKAKCLVSTAYEEKVETSKKVKNEVKMRSRGSKTQIDP